MEIKKHPNCIPFLGIYLDNFMYKRLIPEKIFTELKAETFCTRVPNETRVERYIETAPLADFWSIVHPALHFSMYTHPKRIFLVGCDNSNNGYIDPSLKQIPMNTNILKHGFELLKKHRDYYYPDIDIISVNPIGLKGLFTDVYTQSYIDDKKIKVPNNQIFENII